jgi:hypothetical protein
LLAGESTKGIKSDELWEILNVLTYGLVVEGAAEIIDCVWLTSLDERLPENWKHVARRMIERATFPILFVGFSF